MESKNFMAKDDYSEWMERNDMVCVTIYASDTDLFTEEEIDELVNSVEYYTEMIDIPVPRNLLFEWFCEWAKMFNYEPNYEDFEQWLYEDSTADDTDDLYYWLKRHNYYWKRLDKHTVQTDQYTRVLSIDSGTVYGVPVGTPCTVIKGNTSYPSKLLVKFNGIIDEETGKPVTGWIFDCIITINDK